MIAIRRNHDIFLNTRAACGDNLGLRLDKLNHHIDEDGGHDNKEIMLQVLSHFTMSQSLHESYSYAFNQWKNIMSCRNDCECFEMESTTKVLTGTGNASVHELGVSLNRPWGVPFIPGNTLKGLLSFYLAKYGETDTWWKNRNNSSKSIFQVELFGGTLDSSNKTYGGSIFFHDAWLIPQSNTRWFTDDIINVHYQKYYGEQRMPDGTENPVPVKIAALKPGLRFFVTIQGPKKSRIFLKTILEKALLDIGTGGKTAVGYGRFRILKSPEEIIAQIKRLIETADNDELIKLNSQYGNQDIYYHSFIAALNNKPFSETLEPLYQRFSPLKFILLKIRNNSFTMIRQLNDLYKNQVKGPLQRFIEKNNISNIRNTQEAQEIFDYCIIKMNITTEDIEKYSFLKQIAYTWADIDFSEEFVLGKLSEDLDNGVWVWPPVEGLAEFVRSSEIKEDIKEYLLEYLKEKPCRN